MGRVAWTAAAPGISLMVARAVPGDALQGLPGRSLGHGMEHYKSLNYNFSRPPPPHPVSGRGGNSADGIHIYSIPSASAAALTFALSFRVQRTR